MKLKVILSYLTFLTQMTFSESSVTSLLSMANLRQEISRQNFFAGGKRNFGTECRTSKGMNEKLTIVATF